MAKKQKHNLEIYGLNAWVVVAIGLAVGIGVGFLIGSLSGGGLGGAWQSGLKQKGSSGGETGYQSKSIEYQTWFSPDIYEYDFGIVWRKEYGEQKEVITIKNTDSQARQFKISTSGFVAEGKTYNNFVITSPAGCFPGCTHTLASGESLKITIKAHPLVCDQIYETLHIERVDKTSISKDIDLVVFGRCF